ncbi:MAG: glycerol-3-phosphate acyltransferase [Bacteroidota bacterium]
MSDYLVSLCISYLIGSFPTAYLVVKRTSQLDIRTAGSGNVGGRNALEVTGKKSIGVLVVAIDVLKGIISVTLAVLVFADRSAAISAAMAGVVLGHCYPVWLRFKGGRGLATAAGVMLVTGWIWVVLWLALYFTSSKATDNVHLSSVIALVATPLVAWFLPDTTPAALFLEYFTEQEFFTAALLPLAVSLSRHVGPLKEFYEKKNI